MFITTLMVTIIMLFIWKTSILLIVLFFIVFGGIELMYLSSTLYKFVEGGYLPLAFSIILILIMGIWHYVHVQRYKYELRNKVSGTYIPDLAQRSNLIRIPGIGLLYSELVQGIPPLLPHFIEKIPSVHSVLVIISVKYLPITKVEAQERFLFRHVEPREHRIFRCVVRYGYKDTPEESSEFEHLLIEQLKQFICQENFIKSCDPDDMQEAAASPEKMTTERVEAEVWFVEREKSNGVVYLIGETEVVAKRGSNIIKRLVVDYAYDFLRRNFRQGEKVMSIPHSKLLRVGMTYEI